MSKNRRARERKYEAEMETIARDWAVHITNKFLGQIQKKNISLTRELLESFTYSINSNEGGNVYVNIQYSAHGKYLDMKKLYYHKMPPIDELEEWVKQRGINRFRYIPGYNNRWYPSEEKHARRIAWGIAANIKKSGVVNQYGKWGRSKQWRVPELRKGIKYLNHLLVEELASVASGNIVTAFQN